MAEVVHRPDLGALVARAWRRWCNLPTAGLPDAGPVPPAERRCTPGASSDDLAHVRAALILDVLDLEVGLPSAVRDALLDHVEAVLDGDDGRRGAA